jgi:regulatory protein
LSDTRTITNIEIQKGKKNRVSVFLDNAFAFGLDQDVLIRAGIARGDVLTEERVAEILCLEERHRAKLKAMRLLAVRSRSRKELTDRLHQAKFSSAAVDWALQEMERLQLINDAEFARAFSQNRMVSKPVGKMLLQRELSMRGLSETEIQIGVQQAYDGQSEGEIARALAVKRKNNCRNLDEQKAKKRVADFLMRRGFPWQVVAEILEEWDQIA